jgi:hypothetical protein
VEFTREEAQTNYIDGYEPDKLSWYDNAGRGSVDLTAEGYGDIDPWASDSLLSTVGGHVLVPNTVLKDSSPGRSSFTLVTAFSQHNSSSIAQGYLLYTDTLRVLIMANQAMILNVSTELLRFNLDQFLNSLVITYKEGILTVTLNGETKTKNVV